MLAGFKDWEHFSNTGGISLEIGQLNEDTTAVLSILGMDPPRHDRIRALVSKGFTPRRVADLEPSIRALAVRYLENVRGAGRMDFVADFAGRIPMDVVSEMLGVPRATATSCAAGRTPSCTATKACAACRPRASPPRVGCCATSWT